MIIWCNVQVLINPFIGKYDEKETVPILYNICGTSSSYVTYVSGKRKGRGEENLFKRDGRKGGFLTIIG